MYKLITYTRIGILLGSALAACNVVSTTPVPTRVTNVNSETIAQTFDGLYDSTSETSSFVPCSMNEFPGPGKGYWLVPNYEFSQLYEKAMSDMIGDIAGTYGPYDEFVIYVRFQGILSPPASVEAGLGYGHLGLYSREVTVTKALEAKYYWVGTTMDTVFHNPCP